MRRGALDARLVAPAAAAWLAAGLLVARPSWGWVCCGAAAGLAAVAGSLAANRKARPHSHGRAGALGLVILVAASVGVVSAAAAAAGAQRHPRAIDTIASGHSVTLDATVTSQARPSAPGRFGAERVTFRATATAVRVGRHVVVGRMPALISGERAQVRPRIGEHLELSGTLSPSLSADSIAFAVFSAKWQRTAPAPGWLGWADGLRERFAKASARLPGDGGALLPGLAIGDESRVSAELDADMKASSLSHLTAVSGSNCAIIVAGLIGLGGAAGFSRRWRLALSLVGLAGFVVLVTPGASVLRAAVMAAIVVLGMALGRPGRALPALALAVVALLVHDPWLARDYGFALSVLATAALLVLAGPLAVRLERWLPRWLAVGLAVPLAAQLACQPVLVMLNPTLPLYGVVANVLAEPAAPIATVVGLVACLVLPFCAPLATPLLWVAWLPSAWIAGIAHTAVALPLSAVPWPAGVLGLALAAALTGLVVILVARPATARGRLARQVGGAVCSLALVGAAALQAGPAIAARAGMPRDWVVGMCDVGQGDAIVLHSGSEFGLIDTGPDEKALTACLHRLGVTHLSLLVLTHYDFDHVGAAPAVAKMAATAMVGTPGDGDALANRLLAELRRNRAEIHYASRGDSGSLGALRWRVLWPDREHPGLSTSNEGSIAIEVDGAGLRMLALADLDEKAQNALIADGDVRPVDVVKVAHHGSADQSQRLYGLLRARLALVSCGAGNDYGHPRASALNLLRAAGTHLARTDLEGTVLVTSRHGVVGLWTARPASDAALWRPAQK